METAKGILLLCGIHSICFAVFHVFFRQIFNWKKELPRLSVANSAILQIENQLLIYFFLLIGCMCFCFPDELLQTSLGNFVLGGTSLFWIIRLGQQFIYLRVNHKMVHILSFLFLAGAILFALPLFR